MATLEKANLVKETEAPLLLCVWTDAPVETVQAIDGVCKARETQQGYYTVYIDPRYDRAELIEELENL